MTTFTPDRSLLNPKFDGYKFSPLDYDEVTTHHPLANRLSQTNVSGRAPLSFQEVQSRVLHNHLALCSGSRRAAYVDAELRVVVVDLDESAAAETLQREYPSTAFVDGTSLLVADGYGALYALRLNDSGAAELLASYELSIPPAYESAHPSVPFRLHQAVSPDGQNILAVLSSKHYPVNVPEPPTHSHKVPPVTFDIWGVQIALPIAPSPDAQPLQVSWHRRGDDVPLYTAYDASRQAFLFVGSSPYLPLTVAPAPAYEPSADELAPIPRAGENLDGTSGPAASDVPKPPPYSWTQTEDTVTLAIPLPSDTPKERIKIVFSPRTLTVLVEDSADAPIPIPRFSLTQLWDGIQPSTSMWTFDRAATGTYGMLALHLDKAHEGTRWPQVFSASSNAEEVPETLDPSELYAIRESLEKYTAALREGPDASGLGVGVPSLGQGERDDEVDLTIGKGACTTWVGVDGAHRADDAALQVLATPFPGAAGVFPPSLVAKNGLDGVVYTLRDGSGSGLEESPAWAHTGTYSALAFVLASKRDTRFVHHVAHDAVFAFESGTQDLGGNVYIYRGVGPRENWAKQTVLKVGGGVAGALLGVGLMKVRSKVIVLCLCEGELVVLHEVL
ncbi:NudC domain-containing protein 1 [Trametes pubescens]|uniref:NudC domain-containing protein 1 n=1 Tax=Trametes pubescens TaxID=154538 RepID=A0A1M2W6A6_TRAPU|nr:NudC domain-containing protein 1 [Trametes pubescens]